jgi:3-methyladenine DNA glycosylase AlkD
MTAQEVLEQLQTLGSRAIKKVLMKHGAREPFYGVKVEDLKKIQKRIKQDHDLAIELYETGISDAMYLAGLIADDARMTRKDLQRWVKQAYWSLLFEYTVPWVASGSTHGHDLALEWIDSKSEGIAAAGWATLSSLVAVQPDAMLDLRELKGLLERVGKTIHGEQNRVRYVMNGFVIAVGTHVEELHQAALAIAAGIGTVAVEMGGTACKLPGALESLEKVAAKASVGTKRKTAKC